ncbi:hypothetical protein OHW85_18875, partial [Acinetobacter baumannii]|nr:hypothetical protein [Acinetobacter baumannii]
MVNRLSFRNLRIDNFKLITWLQIFIIAITPNFIFFQSANATTVSAEGWSVTKRLVQGATTFYDGTKNVVLNGKNYLATGAAAITPTASQVSKMIVRTGAVFAVDLAIKALIGAVDYTMDPANNRVIYYPTTLSFSCTASSITRTASSLQLAAQSTCQAFTANVTYQGVTKISDSQYKCLYKNAGGDQSYTMNCSSVSVENHDKPEYLPYDAVASQIISDAASENSEAKAYVSSVADTSLDLDEQKQIVPATDVINQLNNSQAIPTSNAAQGQAVPQANPDDPTAPPAPPTDITINFPVFCDWAPSVCQAAQAAINFPGTVAGYWTTFNKWMNESASDTSETKPEVKELELNFDDGSRINFDQTCPQPQPIQVTFMGVTQD